MKDAAKERIEDRKDIAGLLLYWVLTDAGGELEYINLVESLGVPEEKVGEIVDEAAREGYVDVSGGTVTLSDNLIPE